MTTSFRKRITSNATTPFTNKSCAITGIFISVNNAGTTWTLKIQDKSSGPFVILPALTLTKTTDAWNYKHFDDPIYMEGGVEAVTAGAAPGEVAVWIMVK